MPDEVNMGAPSSARIYDYMLGGGHNFKIDREAAERLLAAVPARDMARLNRGFLHRAVLFLIDAGIRQFLDLGSGIPTVGDAPETHRLLDLAQQLGLLMVGVLQFVPDSDDPWGVVASYREKLAPGSYLAVSHFTPDGMPERMAQAVEVFKNTPEPAHPRTHAQVMRLFDGFELVAPGLVYTSQWRPESPEDPGDHPHHSNLHGALGRKL